ncbi:Uncharacterised protein [Mycobacteroides abscessus subsp. abscessus]|nr:Uncharacterised protein [Mycobacteroides abscessus subsp. abscessus]
MASAMSLARTAVDAVGTGTRIASTPNNSAALRNAACAVVGRTIDDCPGPAPARSRAAFTASRQLSVPPEVTDPTASGP